MKIRMLLHEIGDNIRIGNAFESTHFDDSIKKVGEYMILLLCKQRALKKSELGKWWSRITLIDASTLQELQVMHTNNSAMKSFRYKNWLCEWNEKEQQFYLYTPDEMEEPKGFRYSETEAQSVAEAKEFIDNF